MHEFVGVVVDPSVERDTVAAVVEKVIEPFREQYDEERDELTGWWDFWSVGGRWTGVWVKGYDPTKDARNRGDRKCFCCNGTGERPDIGDWSREKYNEQFGGCNGCRGTGYWPPHPSNYAPVQRDVLAVSELLDDTDLRVPYRLVLPDSGVLARDEWDGDRSWDPSPEWGAHVRKHLEPYRQARIVVVDVHV